MENQTAVQYLRSEIKDKDNGEIPKWVYKFIDDAILKEKEQIIDARISGFASSAEGWNGEIPCMKWSEMVRETKCEEYYNETFLK